MTRHLTPMHYMLGFFFYLDHACVDSSLMESQLFIVTLFHLKGDAKYAYYESEPSIEIEDDENTCLIPRKVEGEQLVTKRQDYISL